MLEIFATNLIWHEFLHFTVASILSLFIFRASLREARKSSPLPLIKETPPPQGRGGRHFRRCKIKKLILIVFLVSFLVDLDHLTEGFLLYGFDLSWLTFFRGNFFQESGRMTILLHGWELLPFILIVGKKVKQWPLSLTIVISLAGHYLVDQLVYSSTYGMSLLEYSLIYRALHRFDWYVICGGC